MLPGSAANSAPGPAARESMTTVSTIAAGSVTRCGRAPVISATAASESGITRHLPRQRFLGRRRLAEVAHDRRGGHLTIVEGDDRGADVLATLMPLARHHDHVPLAGHRDSQADRRGPVRLDYHPGPLLLRHGEHSG